MPADYYAIPGCSTSRATPDVALLGMLEGNDENNVNQRKNTVDTINKIQMIDASLRRQIGRKSIHFYEKYYPEEN